MTEDSRLLPSNQVPNNFNMVVEMYQESKRENERLRAALEKYGQHGDGCPAWDAQPCTCGFDALSGDSSASETKSQPDDGLIAALHLLASEAISPIHRETACRAIRALNRYSSAQETTERCVHNLIASVSTLTVIDPYKAKCRVCLEFFDLPLEDPSQNGKGDV